jgi:hypothetical protein
MSHKINQNSMRWMIFSVMFLVILAIGLAWVFYSLREPYEFFRETISMLGGIQTEHSYNNFPSYAIFTIGFLLVSVLSLVTSILYLANTEDFEYAILKGVLMLVIAIGTFGTAIMHDLLKIVHGIGAFLFVSGFGVINFVWQLLRYIRKREKPPEEKKWDFYLDAVFVWILFASILVYFCFTGIYYFLGYLSFTYVATSQKVLLICIVIATFLLDREDM